MKLAHWFKGICRPAPQVSPPIELSPPEKVILPLLGHYGLPCESAVEVGDAVEAGQIIGQGKSVPMELIADSGQALESHEHSTPALVRASISGQVEEIKQIYDSAGQKVTAVVIKGNGQSGEAKAEEGALAAYSGVDEISATPLDKLLSGLDLTGVGLSNTMGPKHYVSMNGIKSVRGIETLIVRAVDYDPPIAPNAAALASDMNHIKAGVTALAHITSANKVILALPKGQESAQLNEMAGQMGWEIQKVHAGHYPYAVDNLLIYNLTCKEVPYPDGDPRDLGVVVESMQTAVEVGKALLTGQPDLDTLVSVAGAVNKPGTFRVRLGTPISAVLEEAGGLPDNAGKVIIGGPMKGYAHFDMDSPITREIDGLFVQAADEMENYSSHPCIHCGACAVACPVSLVPGELSKLCEFGQYEIAAENDLFQCFECGVCAYVCPAKRPMVQLLRLGKAELMAKEVD
jgi:electron transport complex protein RnfC